jgi:hypothetical protein
MDPGRPLTSGEIDVARSIYGEAIDLAQVRIVNRKWWPLQPRNVAMAPCGHIHFHPHGDLWSEDFSREALGKQGLFIHELTHVWQSQLRGRYYLPLMRHRSAATGMSSGQTSRSIATAWNSRPRSSATPS